jgi:hypothetical protein
MLTHSIEKDPIRNKINENYSIIYCPEYASYFACDKRKKTSRIRRFRSGIVVKYSMIERLPEPVIWNGEIIEYEIIFNKNHQKIIE